MTNQEVIDALEENGWILDRIIGSYHIFKKPGRSGHVTVPQPRKDMAIATLKIIERQCGFKLKR